MDINEIAFGIFGEYFRRRGMEGKTLRKDERAVSAVIGVILMIAITVVIAAVVAAFAYGIIGSVKTAPSSSLVIENAQRSTSAINVTLIHQGGDIITDAFNGTGGLGVLIGSKWKNVEVRHNGAKLTTEWAWMNTVANSSTTAWSDDFTPGDELKIQFSSLASDDTIAVVYTPSGDILQRVKVA
jgi:flagellin-like protein